MSNSSQRRSVLRAWRWEAWVAFRFLRAGTGTGMAWVTTGFSWLGIVVGTFALVVGLAAVRGLIASQEVNLVGLLGHVMLEPLPQDAAAVLDSGITEELAALLGIELTRLSETVPPAELRLDANWYSVQAAWAQDLGADYAIRFAAPIVTLPALISVNNQVERVQIFAVAPDFLEDHPQLRREMYGGTAETWRGAQVTLGWETARRLGVGIGDEVTLIGAQGNTTLAGWSPEALEVRIANTSAFPGQEAIALMPYDMAQAFAGLGEAGFNRFDILFAEQNEAVDASAGLRDALDAAGLEPGSIAVTSWEAVGGRAVKAYRIVRIFMALMLSFIIAVGAMNILSAQFFSVQQKTQAVATLRTFGVGWGAIMRIFFMTSAALGLLGALTGWLAGLVVTRSNLKTQFDILLFEQRGDELLAFALALSITLLASLPPAWRAGRIPPAEALRSE